MDRPSRARRRIVKRFMDETLADRIGWAGARPLLERIAADPAYGSLDPELRTAIEAFLAAHHDQRGGAPDHR